MKSVTNDRRRQTHSLTLSSRLALHQADDQTTTARLVRARALAADPSWPNFEICRAVAGAVIETEVRETL